VSCDVLLVVSTFPEREVAQRVARVLVESRLAACANISAPIESIYRWKEKIETSQEVIVFFKVPTERYEEFERRLDELHPYDLPEIIALPVTRGSHDYLRWVSESCESSVSG